MTDRDRAEMRALADQFRELMVRDVERTVFDKEACLRIGQMIGRAALVGSECSYPASLGPRISVYRIPGRG
jgi:hypothetical protein